MIIDKTTFKRAYCRLGFVSMNVTINLFNIVIRTGGRRNIKELTESY